MRWLCVTPNASVDTTYRVDRLIPGGITRVQESASVPGGKGNNVARVLAKLGHEVVATGFAGGRPGAFLDDELRARSIEPRFVAVDGETRTCLAIVEDASPPVTELLEPGPVVDAHAVDELRELVARLAAGAHGVVLSGSLPAGAPDDLYADLIAGCRSSETFVVLDTSGPALRAGLAAQPDLVKPNRSELRALGAPADGDVASAVNFVQGAVFGAAGLGQDARVLLSLGESGAVLIGPHGALGLEALRVRAVNPVGAGDALVAGYLDAWSRGMPDAAALTRAVTVAAASTLQPVAGVVDARDVERLLNEPPARLACAGEVPTNRGAR